jgi:hypothetical protein
VVFDRVRPRRTAVFGVLARGRRACPAGFAAGVAFFEIFSQNFKKVLCKPGKMGYNIR